MKFRWTGLFGLFAGLALFAAGCSNTSDGMAKDADANSKMGAKSSSDAMEGATKATRDVTAAVSLTPPIKLAIAGDSNLNSPDNKIDVDSDENQVKLTGTVVSDAARKQAEELALRIMKDHKSSQTLVNELKVQPPVTGEPK